MQAFLVYRSVIMVYRSIIMVMVGMSDHELAFVTLSMQKI